MISDIHGNAKSSASPGGSSPIGSTKPSNMTWKLAGDAPADSPGRPLLTSHQSSSLPSTPYQRSRNLSFHSRSPSPHGSASPRSTHSESTHLPPSSRKPLGGCKYETAMAYFRRRMPYSLGGDLLPEEKGALSEQLGQEEEQKLTADMTEIYDRLLPSAESDDRRQQLVRKLEKLFNDQWPGREIRVHIFGSSGNKLCSSHSDVDICITTTSKELEHVCLLAEVLARHGMERVVCVSHAKVPIVKIWDPELRLACDMNVNNTLALENTRMIRTYVEIDERVRPLAMIIKHWTKRRVLNDAGLGGTLSSYTWICLIINFLQTRNPPILPSLQARPHEKRVTADGLICSFDDDHRFLSGYGRKNKQTLGALLFDFFRYYAHELNYEKNVISVRGGNLLSKEAKGWHLLQNNRLCVEEPFNTSRNLGNTADDTAFRGVHLELRRAFRAVVEGKLDDCCEQYEFPPEEERCFERPPPQPRPVLSNPSQSYRGGRGGGRGGRNSSHFARGGFNNRRPSHTPSKPGGFRHGNGPPDVSYQAQQAQHVLHDQLYQQIQILQAQEQELRMQLQNQALLTGRSPPVLVRQPFMQFPVPQHQESASDENSRSRSGTVDHPPLNPSMRQNVYYAPGYMPFAVPGVQASNTNPPSPSATSAVPELRRSPRRSSAANGSPKGSNRAHSQPARSLHSPTSQSFAPLYSTSHPGDSLQDSKQRNGSVGGTHGDDDNCFMSSSMPSGAYDNQQPEFMGYYLASSPQGYQQNPMLSPMSGPVGLALQQNGFLSFVANPQEYISLLRTNEPAASSDQTSSSGSQNGSSQQQRSTSRPEAPGDRGPLIVDGSVPLSEQRSSVPGDGVEHYTAMSHCTSNSDDPSMDTPVSVSDTFSQDFQDNSSIEMDQGSFFSRKPVGTNDSANLANGHVKPGLLASRLQNLHLSNSESLPESAKTGPERPKMVHSYQEIAAKEVPRPKQPTSAAEKSTHASGPPPAAEPNSRLPNGKRQPNGVEHSDKVNGINHKPRPKGRFDLSHQNSATMGDRKDRQADHHRKPNGVGPTTGTYSAAAAQGSSGWQVSKKKNKRSNKSPGEPRRSANGGPEPLPTDESLRKGG